MRYRLITVLWLATVWVLLWQEYDLRSAIGGLAVGAFLAFAVPIEERPRHRFHAFRVLPALQFAVFFVGQVIKANAIVAWEVITPGSRVREGIVAIPVSGGSDPVVTTVAYAISLTPGTLLVEVAHDPTVLYVHVLHLRSIDQVRLDILDLERRATRVLGSRAALVDVERRIEELRAQYADHRGGAAS